MRTFKRLRNVPFARGICCESDGLDCTKDICDGAGKCVHPEKDDPLPIDLTANWSFSKNFTKKATLPLLGRVLGVQSQVFFKSEQNASGEGGCSAEGTVKGGATVRTDFLGQLIEVTGSGGGSWKCDAPVLCTDGCNNRLACDIEDSCCSTTGTVNVSLAREFEKRWPLKPVGSVYLRALVGGGIEGTATKTGPGCSENHWSLVLDGFVEASGSGGLEICNNFTKALCDCKQGRDPWTGRFETACSDCSRCSPYGEVEISGRLGGSFSWSNRGFSAKNTGQVCFTVSSLDLGPFEFKGYQNLHRCRKHGWGRRLVGGVREHSSWTNRYRISIRIPIAATGAAMEGKTP